ncbi:MAG: Flp pilus assembly protein TadD [Elusimicrobia bacterium]|nr:MAG: Flp pilus assembly protein TadD [Elusimicrobiota bacterium]KAF0154862.1 MAG: Flp pilus assembly protein TadD [Elusimicrobiota bacterium]
MRALALILLLAYAAASAGDTMRHGVPVPLPPAAGAADARLLYGAGREAEAREALAAALKANPSDEDAYSFLLEILPDASPAAAAPLEETARGNLKKSPTNPVYYLGLCKSYRAAGDMEKAEAACRAALELDPVFHPSYRELALTYEAAGDSRRALETAAQWAEISGGYKAFAELGRLRSRYADFAGARTALARASALAARSKDPEAPAWRRRASSYTSALAAAERKAPSAARGAGRAGADDCAEKAAADNAAGRHREAEEAAAACLRRTPGHAGLLEVLADASFALGYYESALDGYAKAASYAKKDRALIARVLRKKAGIHLRMGAEAKAKESYEEALLAGPEDKVLLRELADFRETRSDHKGAFDLYSRLLELRPGDAGVRRKRDELEVPAMSAEDLAAELESRGVPLDGKRKSGPENREILSSMREAEASGAVDHLKEKLGRLTGLTLERQDGSGKLRLLLTHKGFESWLTLRTRDAVKFFEKKGMDFRHIFSLRDKEGAPFFEKGGRLTRRGASAYLAALGGSESWIMPYEDVPASPAVEKAKTETDSLVSGGYKEIFEPEYLWLMKATDCPQEVMLESPIFMKEIRTPARIRYFICVSCAYSNKITELIALKIEDYRAGNTHIQTTGGTAFFGRAGVAPPKLCVDGRVAE